MRIHQLVFLLLTFSTSLAGRVLQESQDPIGMILSTSGEVFVEREGERSAARLADLLHRGDQVITAAGEVNFLHCPSQEKITLRRDSRAELSHKVVEVLQGQTASKERIGGCALPHVELGSENLERVGGLRARRYPPIVLYLGGSVLTTRPLFEWVPIENAQSYLLTLRNEMGAVVWEQKTDTAGLAYPDSMASLQNEDYRWEVTALSDGKTIAQQWANFRVKSEPDLAENLKNQSLDRLTQATLLENGGYFSEAAAHYREIRKVHMQDPRFTRHLAWLYWNAGLIAAANQESDKLDPAQTR